MSLPDEAVVFRGGLSSVDTLRVAAENTLEHEGMPGVSAFVVLPDQRLMEVLAESKLPHKRIRLTTIGALKEAGFGVELTPPDHHVTIGLGPEFDERDLYRLEEVFGPPQQRPEG